MQTPLLIITADVPFGELIRHNLEETGRFVVGVTREQEAAMVYARKFNPALAFLDTSLTENDLLGIGALLRQANPEIIFVVVSEAGWHSALEELFPRDYLSKPFNNPDLMEMMEKFFGSSSTQDTPSLETADTRTDFPWLTDVTRAAQHLTRLTLESSAQAALITRFDQLWAYAGQLPQPAACELAETLSRYWDHHEENDLVRFVRLDSTNAEHMLYATRLAEGMVLALVFDAETPFSTIRTQASQLVHSLSTSPSEESQYENMSGSETNPNSLSTILPGNPALHPLTDIPSGSGYDLGASVPGSRKEPSLAIPLPSTGLSHFNRDSSPAARLKSLIETDQTQSPSAPHGDSIPGSSKEIARKIVLEPASPAFYNIDYACLLVPRFPQHHMTGDLLDRLGEWMLQICIAYGWRLEDISVQPEYLQWIINVPPAASPDHLMRILRQHTSEKIFTEFPRFKKENPSGEFWAPGYLIMGGSQPPPVQLIKDFIAQTRQRQGIHQQIRQ